jgi:hypothetical protein
VIARSLFASLIILGAAPAHAEVSAKALIRAAKSATISEIDYQRQDCNDRRSVEDWLTEVAGDSAKSVRWHGGKCVLAIPDRPRDAGTKWCAHAVIQPRSGKKASVIEIYFEAPKGGKPGAAFAFRAHGDTKDGFDYMRETRSFEIGWRETNVPNYQPPESGNVCD